MKHCIDHIIIPAGGMGTGMIGAIPGIPANFPKELLPIGGKPAIQYAVLEGFHAGVREFTIVLRTGKDIIRHIFEVGEYPGGLKKPQQQELDTIRENSEFNFVYQEDLDGPCGAILAAKEHVRNRPFGVIYPTLVAMPHPGCFTHLCDTFRNKHSHTIGLMEVTEENAACLHDTGRIDLDGEYEKGVRIRHFHPDTDSYFEPRYGRELRACGMYLALPDYMDAIAELKCGNPRIEITDNMVRETMLASGTEFYGIRLPEEIHEAGNPEGFWRCASIYAKLLNQ